MRPRTSVYLLLLLGASLAFAPHAAAQTTEDLIWNPGEEGHQLQWRVLERNFENTDAVKTANFTWLKYHSHEKAINESILLVDLDVTITSTENQNGVWNYTLQMANGGGMVDLGACYWHHRTANAGVLGGNLVTRTTYTIACAAVVDVAEDGVITYWINRTVLSGTPSVPTQTHVTITADRADFVVYPMDIDLTTVADQFIPFLFWFGFTAWLLTRNAILPAFGTTIVALGLFVPGLPWTATWGYLWLILTVWVHFIAGEKIYSRLFREARTE